jgi:hypothetical protein
MKHSIGKVVYVNYEDGMMMTQILDVSDKGYRIEIKGKSFLMGFNEVSESPNQILGVKPIRRASSGAEE